MSLSALNWRYVGSQSFGTATCAAVLDALYTLGTSATYADGSARTEGASSAWTFSGNRYQNAGTTEALYPAPPTNTLTAKYCIAGCASLPTPNPTMAFSDTAAANVLMATMTKNAGAFASWNAASPFTSGTNFDYVRVWPTTAGTGNILLWESQETLLIILTTSSGGTYWMLLGAWVDPESTDTSLDAESDGKLYGIMVTGSGSACGVSFWTSSTSQEPFKHAATNGYKHCAIFAPGGSSKITLEPACVPVRAMTTTRFKSRSGRYGRIALGVCSDAAAPNDNFIGRLREIFAFSDGIVPTKQTNAGSTIGYCIGSSSTSNSDAIFLAH